MTAFTTLDVLVLVAYLVGITVWGAWLGRGQKGATDYFLGSRSLPWVAVMLSVVATETSTLTFLSVPGVSYAGSLVFLQLTLGYLVGRIAVSAIFLPAYYRGELSTAYALLEDRFGLGARRATSAIFMVTRLLADSVRLFATAIPLALITGWPYPASIAVIGVLTVTYTYFGGIKAVVWVDVVQMGLYLLGAVVAIVALQLALPDGWSGVFSSAGAAGKMQVVDFTWNLTTTYTIWAGVIGGAVFTMASHGTDQLIVQRLLTCTDQRAAQKALVGSGIAVIFQFLLFLMVGLGLWAFYGGREFDSTDEIFATFILQELPPGLTGLLIAGVFAAAMSSLSSSINALASATAYDFWAPMVGARDDEVRILKAGKAFTLVWAALLIGGAILFIPLSEGTSAVEAALGIAALVYGGLLGVFALGVFTKRPGQGAAILGIVIGIGTVILLRDRMAWPWYVPAGATVTLVAGSLAGLFQKRSAEPSDLRLRFLIVTLSLLGLVCLGVPTTGLLLLGLIGGFLSVPTKDTNKFLSPLLTIGVTNVVLWVLVQSQISSTPRLSPSSSPGEISSVISGIVSGGNQPLSNWFERWELFVVMMVMGSIVGILVQNRNPVTQTVSSTPQPSSSPSDSLQSLTDMKEKGLITDEEFESKKKELLGRM